MSPRCPECGDNHIKMLAQLSDVGEVKNSVAKCSNGHEWDFLYELKTHDEYSTIELLTRRDNDI